MSVSRPGDAGRAGAGERGASARLAWRSASVPRVASRRRVGRPRARPFGGSSCRKN
ncbi:hypothetical protein BURPSPAST_J0377 [Burkholderia pseudomallei Pasteur 52237]|nr:hypothetical protein BURPSPAST_J0377 [Burkholderia pseudomallei Pasteur 52237]